MARCLTSLVPLVSGSSYSGFDPSEAVVDTHRYIHQLCCWRFPHQRREEPEEGHCALRFPGTQDGRSISPLCQAAREHTLLVGWRESRKHCSLLFSLFLSHIAALSFPRPMRTSHSHLPCKSLCCHEDNALLKFECVISVRRSAEP